MFGKRFRAWPESRGQAINQNEGKTHKLETEDLSLLSVVRCFDSITLPKAGEYFVRGKVDINKEGVMGLFEPVARVYESRVEGSLMASGLVEVDSKGRIPVRIWTFKDNIRLKKGAELGTLLICRESEGKERICQITEPDMEGRWKLLKTKFENKLNELPSLERQVIVPLLKEFADIFSVDKNDIGLTTLVSHEIDTGEASPIACQHRRVPIHLEDKVEKMVQDFVDKGIIRPSESPWNAPLVVVPKKNGDIRLTVDYRKINAITKRPIFPIPDTRQLLDTLHGSAYYTTLDLSSGYYNVPMHEPDICKTAFSTRKNHWEFIRMPMGLSTSPSTFQRLMHKVFNKENWEKCLIYLDDILVFSRDLKEQVERLRTIFERIRDAGLKLSPEKCEFLKREVSYLGYTVTKNGTKTDERKISKIKNCSMPKSAEELRSWLGLCGYYRQFIQNFAQLVAPLEKMCTVIWNKKKRKETKIEWSLECQESFEKLKKALTNAPVLAYPTTKGQFILDTDASHNCMGSVLSQIQDGQEKVIAYASKKFSQSERQYCITRKELLAVHHFVHHFKHYLLGRQFIVRTDHRALTWMLNWKTPNTSQYCRWRQELEIFDMVVQYRRGNEHANADALSRLPQCQQCELKHLDPKRKTNVKNIDNRNDEIFCRNITCFEMNIDQEKDRDLLQIIKLLKVGKIDIEEPNEIRDLGPEAFALWKKRSKLRLRGGMLYLLIGESQYKLLVPKDDRRELVKMTHENFAHIGAKKTYNLLNNKYYWMNMDFDVRLFIGTCRSCAERKSGPNRKHSKESLQSNYPFQKLSLDVTGPLQCGRHGERYILGIVDNFSRYTSLIPLKRATAVDVARALYKKWICLFGAPEVIHSDRGTEFENRVIYELCAIFGIRKSKSSPYYPRGNGMIERIFRTVKDMLHSTIKSTGKNWSEVLPTVEMALRCTKHSALKFSPYEVVFGRPMETPLINSNEEKCKKRGNTPTCEYVKSVQASLQRMHELIRKNNSNQRQEECQTVPYDDGITVMAKIFPEKHGLKYARYKGPYVIIKRKGWCYTLKHVKTGKVIQRNHYHIKRFNNLNEFQDKTGTSVESMTNTCKNYQEVREVGLSCGRNQPRQREIERRVIPARSRRQTVRFGFE